MNIISLHTQILELLLPLKMMGLSEPTPTGSLHLIGNSIRQIIRLSKSHNLYFHALFSKCIRTNPDHFDMRSLVTHYTVRLPITMHQQS